MPQAEAGRFFCAQTAEDGIRKPGNKPENCIPVM